MASSAASRAGSPPDATALRGVLAGAVCAVGAMGAHVLGGGTVTPVAAVLATGVSVLLGPKVLALRVDVAHTFALSLIAQGVWHTLFMVGGGPMSHRASATGMALQHLLATALATLVAVRAEQTLVTALDWLLGLVVPRLPAAYALGVPRARPRLTQWHDDTRPAPVYDPARPLRAPPRPVLLG